MNKNTTFHKLLSITYKGALLCIALLFFVLLYPTSSLTAESVTFTIIHSGNVKGHLFPCPT